MGSYSASMYNTLWDALVVETVDFLSRGVVFEQIRTSVVFADYSEPVIGGELLDTVVGRNAVLGIIMTDSDMLAKGR